MTTWDDVRSRITGAGHAHLATVGAGGEPAVAVVAPVVDGDVLWVFTGARSAKARNLAANPAVAMVWEGNGAESYVWGTAELVDDLDEKRRIWSSGLLPYDPVAFFGAPDDVGVALVRITPTRASVHTVGEHGPTVLRWQR